MSGAELHLLPQVPRVPAAAGEQQLDPDEWHDHAIGDAGAGIASDTGGLLGPDGLADGHGAAADGPDGLGAHRLRRGVERRGGDGLRPRRGLPRGPSDGLDVKQKTIKNKK